MTQLGADPACDLVIIGGGFAGLSLAYRHKQYAPDARCLLLEASARLGGKARTEIVETEHGRFVVEAGPDSFLATKPWARDLAGELGLADRLIPINSRLRPVSILKNSKLIQMPEGLSLAAPGALKPFLRSPLLSPRGRERALRETRIPASNADADESVGVFIRRRLGTEALDWIAEPLMAGIYNADPDSMSLLATFPQLRVQERSQEGLIRAAVGAARGRAVARRPPTFLTFKDGMQEFTDALANAAMPGTRTSTMIASVRPRSQGGYLIEASGGETIAAKQVALAVSAGDAARLLQASFPDVAAMLRRFRANPAGSISLAYRNDDVKRPLPGYGMLAPLREGRPINAITVASKKFGCRAPDGWMLLRIFFGGARSPGTMLLDDGQLRQMVAAQLRELLGIATEPLFTRVFRWPAGSPQYDVGHLDRVAEIEAGLPAGLHLLGSPYRGVGFPDLAHESEQMAVRLACASV